MTFFFIKWSRLVVRIWNVGFYYQRTVIEWSSGYRSPVLEKMDSSITEIVQISDVDCI